MAGTARDARAPGEDNAMSMPGWQKKIRKWIYRDYFGDRHRLRRRFGAVWLLRYSNSIDRKLILGELYEAEQLAYCSELIGSRSLTGFIDIGANIGLYTVILGTRHEGLEQIHCFEPDIRNFNNLCAHLLLNNLSDRVQAQPVGLSSQAGSVRFLRNKGNSTGHSRIADTAPQSTRSDRFEEVSIPITTADIALASLQGQRLLVKIDVEGHELQVCEGAATLLANNICYVQMEILEEFDRRVAELGSRFGLRLIHRIGQDCYFTNEAA